MKQIIQAGREIIHVVDFSVGCVVSQIIIDNQCIILMSMATEDKVTFMFKY